jgi:hypothetical protein
MGYTMHDIYECYSHIIDTYKFDGYREVPYSSIINYSTNEICRSSTLVNTHNISESVVVELISKKISSDYFSYPVYAVDLDVNVYINHQLNRVRNHLRFYCLDTDYYTIYPYELNHARELNVKRYLEAKRHNNKVMYLNMNRLSVSLKSYLHNLIQSKLHRDLSCKKFSINELYFTYCKCDRKLVAVVKFEDCKQLSIAIDFKNSYYRRQLHNKYF